LRGEISQSASRARSLEEQHKWDREQIEAFNKTISEKQTTIWRLTKENEKKQTSLDRLVARVKKISADEKEDHRMIRELEEWKKADKVHDDAVEKLVNELEKKVETQTAETKKAESKADTASKRVKVLEAENAGLATLEAQLTERIKHIAEQLKKLEGDFGVSEGQKATLEALLCELKKKEFNAKIEIESLHQRLHDAKDIVKDAKLEVKKAQLHAKNHWGTLENIRMDGGWLRTYESDECEEKTMVPICRLGPSEPLTRPAADIQASVN
jgi:chromosome segregation ATPase